MLDVFPAEIKDVEENMMNLSSTGCRVIGVLGVLRVGF